MTTQIEKNNLPFAFFGTGPIAEFILEELMGAGLVPEILVTSPDKPAGRGNILTAPPVKRWADTHGIPTLQPEKIDDAFLETLRGRTAHTVVFVVADYGKILPQALIDIPPKGIVNVHPSLLPRLRGPSPIRSAILTDEKETGVTIMLVDAKMDHGPILAQKKVSVDPWPPHAAVLEEMLAREGGRLLALILPQWALGDIEAREQNHDLATFCHFIKKEDALIHLTDDPYQNLLKIRAYEGWPGAYTFFERHGKQLRVQIIAAHIENNKLSIDTVKPEGKGEMSYADFVRSGATPVNVQKTH